MFHSRAISLLRKQPHDPIKKESYLKKMSGIRAPKSKKN